MKITDKKTKQSTVVKPKTYPVPALKLTFWVFSFLPAVCWPLTSLAGSSSSSKQARVTNSTLHPSSKASQQAGVSELPGSANHRVAQNLWRARISFPKTPKSIKEKTELERLIKQIRSIQFEHEKDSSETVITIEPAPTAKPNEKSSHEHLRPEPARIKADLNVTKAGISRQTLLKLGHWTQHPDRVKNPLELGRTLYLSGNLKEAAVFYRESLNRSDPNDNRSARERAWILFQIGNCLRKENPEEAQKTYRELIEIYPDSPWIEPAKALEKLLQWYQKEKPQTLVEANIVDGEGQ